MNEHDDRDLGEFTEKPSKYVWRWTVWSWTCVGIAALFLLMWFTLDTPRTPGIILALLIAVGGGIAFGFVPRAALTHQARPMTDKARRKSAGRDTHS